MKSKKIKKSKIFSYGLLSIENPKKIGEITSKYPETMSDDWFEHYITKMGIIKIF